MKTNRHAGDVNLRGKKTCLLGCGCCEVFDARADLNKKFELTLAESEIVQTGTVECDRGQRRFNRRATSRSLPAKSRNLGHPLVV